MGGIVQAVASARDLLAEAAKTAAQHAQLGAKRSCMEYTKMQVKGEVAREILSHIFPGGRQTSAAVLPPGLLKHVTRVVLEGALDNAWGASHIGAGAPSEPVRSRL